MIRDLIAANLGIEPDGFKCAPFSQHGAGWARYMSTVSAMRHNPVIKAFAERLAQAGKPAKVVIVACMRKLLTIMNAMIRNNAPWNPKIA